jgi:hypothetical protein
MRLLNTLQTIAKQSFSQHTHRILQYGRNPPIGQGPSMVVSVCLMATIDTPLLRYTHCRSERSIASKGPVAKTKCLFVSDYSNCNNTKHNFLHPGVLYRLVSELRYSNAATCVALLRCLMVFFLQYIVPNQINRCAASLLDGVLPSSSFNTSFRTK